MLLTRQQRPTPSTQSPQTRSARRLGRWSSIKAFTEQSPACFPEHMQQLEAILPSMSCSQLAQTGTSVRETFRAALLSSECSAGGDDQGTQSLVEYFHSELPNQSWLLTYRTAVEQHLVQQQQQPHAQAGDTQACTPQHLAEILATIAALPIQVVQPLPIGFGTPRWSRPMAAADPAAWEGWLANLTITYANLLAAQLQQQQQQQLQLNCSGNDLELQQQLADFTISLACSMRYVNVNVDDDRLQMAEYRDRVLQCLSQQQRDAQADVPFVDPQMAAQSADGTTDLQQPTQQQQPADDVPFALAGSLAHRITFTCLLLLLPPPRPLLAAFFAATSPTTFSLPQLQSIVRGLLFVGSAPPEPWLRGLVELVRGSVGDMTQKELQGFVEGFRFFGTQVGRPAWLRDVTALMQEFSCEA